MAKRETPTFTLTRRLIVSKSEACYLDKKMNILGRIYNVGVKHCIHVLNEIKEDRWYQHAIKAWRKETNESIKKQWAEEIFFIAANYKLTEYDLHEFLGKCRNIAYKKSIGSSIVQKTGTHLYQAVKKALFEKRLHYRKFGQTNSFEDKSAKSGIIYKNDGTVYFMGLSLRSKPIREKDYYAQEAMTRKIKYCRILRRPFGSSYRYFVQFIMEGQAPKKLMAMNGKVGLDPGVSTMTAYDGRKLAFIELAKNVGRYTKRIIHFQMIYDHKLRVNNPDCFRSDGTFIKGCQIHRSKGMIRTMLQIKAAYRKRSEYVKQSNGYDTNRLIEFSGNHIIYEPMNYSALAKRSKKTERQDKTSVICQADGTQTTIKKWKRRKRFGQSILVHSPSEFINMLVQKSTRYGGFSEKINIKTYRASQYNHSNNTYTKHKLSERYFKIDEHLVQRDCYSAFLLYHKKNPDQVDRIACEHDFLNFLNCQKKLIDSGIHNQNFGLKTM